MGFTWIPAFAGRSGGNPAPSQYPLIPAKAGTQIHLRRLGLTHHQAAIHLTAKWALPGSPEFSNEVQHLALAEVERAPYPSFNNPTTNSGNQMFRPGFSRSAR